MPNLTLVVITNSKFEEVIFLRRVKISGHNFFVSNFARVVYVKKKKNHLSLDVSHFFITGLHKYGNFQCFVKFHGKYLKF